MHYSLVFLKSSSSLIKFSKERRIETKKAIKLLNQVHLRTPMVSRFKEDLIIYKQNKSTFKFNEYL